jgi:hypothetical protein
VAPGVADNVAIHREVVACGNALRVDDEAMLKDVAKGGSDCRHLVGLLPEELAGQVSLVLTSPP